MVLDITDEHISAGIEEVAQGWSYISGKDYFRGLSEMKSFHVENFNISVHLEYAIAKNVDLFSYFLPLYWLL